MEYVSAAPLISQETEGSVLSPVFAILLLDSWACFGFLVFAHDLFWIPGLKLKFTDMAGLQYRHLQFWNILPWIITCFISNRPDSLIARL
jgi:hypothetical protein